MIDDIFGTPEHGLNIMQVALFANSPTCSSRVSLLMTKILVSKMRLSTLSSISVPYPPAMNPSSILLPRYTGFFRTLPITSLAVPINLRYAGRPHAVGLRCWVMQRTCRSAWLYPHQCRCDYKAQTVSKLLGRGSRRMLERTRVAVFAIRVVHPTAPAWLLRAE